MVVECYVRIPGHTGVVIHTNHTVRMISFNNSMVAEYGLPIEVFQLIGFTIYL